MALPLDTTIDKLGFKPDEFNQLSPAIQQLTKRDLLAMIDTPLETAASLGLCVSELNGLRSVISTNLTNANGGSGDGGFRCCCCICCCCCCAVSVDQASAVA
jgi:hypothetical protein